MDAARRDLGCHVDAGQTKNRFSAIELSMQKLTNRIFDLELLEAVARETVAKLETKEKIVAEEIRKLEQLQYERWQSRNNLCEKVWRFSAEHDLCALFNRYLDMPKRVPRELVAFDKSQHPDVVKARAEVDDLKNQLFRKNAVHRSLEEKVMQAKIQLQITKSYRDKDAEVNRLQNDFDEYQEKYYDLESKIATMELKLISWQQLPRTPLAEKKRNFVTASELIARDEISETIKRSKYIVKKESEISRKFAARHN